MGNVAYACCIIIEGLFICLGCIVFLLFLYKKENTLQHFAIVCDPLESVTPIFGSFCQSCTMLHLVQQ